MHSAVPVVYKEIQMYGKIFNIHESVHRSMNQ